MTACRSRSPASRGRQSAFCSSASVTSSSKPSVTPLQADSTIASRGRCCASTMAATRSKQPASATLEPPNLWTTQNWVSVLDMGVSGGTCALAGNRDKKTLAHYFSAPCYRNIPDRVTRAAVARQNWPSVFKSYQWKAPADALANSLVPGCAGTARGAGLHAVHQYLPYLRQFLGRARAYRRRAGADRSRRVSIRQPASAAGAPGGRDRPVPGGRTHPWRAGP